MREGASDCWEMADDRIGAQAAGQQHSLTYNNNNNNNFATGHINIRSMNTGFDEFSNYVCDYGFDVLGLSETWLTPQHES